MGRTIHNKHIISEKKSCLFGFSQMYYINSTVKNKYGPGKIIKTQE